MTCIVGMEFNGRVYLGGDIQGTGENNKVIHTQPKVFDRNGIIFGYMGSYRFGQILEHNLPDPIIPSNNSEIYRWLITNLIPSIRKTLSEHESEQSGGCLIGISNQLWELQEDFSILRSVNGYAACGSGYEYALGSIFTSINISKIKTPSDCIKIIRNAIYAAGTYSPSVGCECVVINTK